MRESHNRAAVAVLVICIICLAVLLYLRYTGADTVAEEKPPVATQSLDPADNEETEADVEGEASASVRGEEIVVVPAPSMEPVPTEDPWPYPHIDPASWELVLVNADHSIGDYVPELSTLEGGHNFDSRAVKYLQNFIDAARSEGLSVVLSSAYRSYTEQEYLFNRKVTQYGGDEERAAAVVSRPGTSEHQTGLCADITDKFYELKTESLENTALFQWMLEHCAEYGFILRYPKGREDVTGIIYEPWHFRYVGKESAAYIMENDLTLEEFLALYE